MEKKSVTRHYLLSNERARKLVVFYWTPCSRRLCAKIGPCHVLYLIIGLSAMEHRTAAAKRLSRVWFFLSVKQFLN